MSKVYTCEVHAERYTGSLRKLKPTGTFYYQTPFKVKEVDLFRYLTKDDIEDLKVNTKHIGSVHHDSRGDVWMRIE